MSLTKKIAATLKKKGLSQAAGAKAAGVAYQSFVAVAKGDSKPNARTLPKYAAFLEISEAAVAKLIGGSAAPAAKPAAKKAAPKKAAPKKTVKKAAPKKTVKKAAPKKTVKKAAPKKPVAAAPNKGLLRSLNAALKDINALKTKVENAIKAAS